MSSPESGTICSVCPLAWQYFPAAATASFEALTLSPKLELRTPTL